MKKNKDQKKTEKNRSARNYYLDLVCQIALLSDMSLARAENLLLRRYGTLFEIEERMTSFLQELLSQTGDVVLIAPPKLYH